MMKTVNLVNNLLMFLSIAKKDVKSGSILKSNFLKFKKLILIKPENLDKFKKLKNHPKLFKSQKKL